MKIEREKLISGLRIANLMTAQKGNFPILGCVLIDGETQKLYASDLETAVIVPMEMKDVIVLEPKPKEEAAPATDPNAPAEPSLKEKLEAMTIEQLEVYATENAVEKPKAKKPTAKAWVKAITEAAEKSAAKEAEKAGSRQWEKYCLPAAQLLKIVNSIPDKEIEIRPSDSAVATDLFAGKNSVTIGANFRNMAYLPADEFPVIVDAALENTVKVEFSTDNLIDCMKAASSDVEAGFKLSVVHFDAKRQEMVATDGHRLHLLPATVSEKESDGYNVGIKFLDAAAKVGKGKKAESLTLEVTPTAMRMQIGDVTFVGRPLETKYPDYPAVLPKSKSTLVVTREAVEAALKQSLLLSGEQSRGAKMTFNGTIEIQLTNPDRGEYVNTSIPVVKKLSGGSVEMGLNPRYFLTAIRTAPEDKDEITIGVTDASSPVTFKHHQFFGVVMPMRI